VVVVLIMTTVPRVDDRIGLPQAGAYRQLLSRDDSAYGGSGYETSARLVTEPVAWHGHAQSARFRLPPLGALLLAPEA
jgi:1,4-alpha-glucan branching enzyme